MNFILIVVCFSSWNGEITQKTVVGQFEDLPTCQKEADKLQLGWKYNNFICVEKPPINSEVKE